MFKKAELFLTNPTIALTGPTGSGKTMSALRLASGIAKAMGGRFAVIDTENGSASLYSKLFDFDTMAITPPFTTEKFINAINAAEQAGFCALICDSITHAWAGEGGLLEQKDALDSRPNSNRWTNWGPIKAKDLRLKNAYLHSTIPFFIATMRSKMEYAQSQNAGEKAKVQKVGMAPVQSEGIEYEFSVVFDIAMNHECEVSKDRTHLFDQERIFQITENTGKKFVDWRASGKEKPAPPPMPTARQSPRLTGVIPKKVEGENYSELQPVFEDPPQFIPEDIDDIDQRLESPAIVIDAAGDYKVKFGRYKDWKICDIEINTLKSYCEFIIRQANEKKTIIDPKSSVGEFLDKAGTWMGV